MTKKIRQGKVLIITSDLYRYIQHVKKSKKVKKSQNVRKKVFSELMTPRYDLHLPGIKQAY